MTDDTPKPMDADVLAVLAVERGRGGPSSSVRARALGRLQQAIAPGGGPGGGGNDGPGGGGGADGGVTPDLAPPDLASIAPEPAASLAVLLRAHPLVTAGAGYVAGLVSGISLYAALASPAAPSPVPAPSVMAATPPPAIAASAVAVPVPETVPPAPVPPVEPVVARQRLGAPSASAAPPASAPAEAPSGVASAGANLSAERALLDVARAALARGEGSAAFDALNQHRERFERGVFVEEREALTVQALRDTGRLDEARARALAFKGRYPKSLFLTTVERVLESNP